MALEGPSLDPFNPPLVFFAEAADVAVLRVLRPAGTEIFDEKFTHIWSA